MLNIFIKVKENEPWGDYGIIHKDDLEAKLAEITTKLGDYLYYTTVVLNQ